MIRSCTYYDPAAPVLGVTWLRRVGTGEIRGFAVAIDSVVYAVWSRLA